MRDQREWQAIWYGGKPPGLWLRALAGVYAVLTALRRSLYRRGVLRSVRLRVPVVVVGNITVGGTGKTPMTIALIAALRARGFRPGVISRGYGGSARVPQIVSADADPAQVGDEPVLIARATGVPVAIGRDRAAAARLLLQVDGIDLVIADDGLQHYKLCSNVEICVIDGERRSGNGRLLPAGPLREPGARLESVDFRVCNGGVRQSGEYPMRLIGDLAVALLDETRKQPLHAFTGRRVHAVAAIGNPQRFFMQLCAAGIDVVEHTFADHHAFAASDLQFADDLPVLMTEKDAVKCRAFANPQHWYVPVRAELPPAFFDAVAARLGNIQCPR
ncbi:MAG: tetraacyldisaccharide 4'-kinase [Rudaea sp.]